eukprot:gene18736-25249_t
MLFSSLSCHDRTVCVSAEWLGARGLAGAWVDLGCYCISAIRALTAGEPRVLSADARRDAAARFDGDAEIDTAMSAEMALPGGATARFECSLVADRPEPMTVSVEGSAATMRVAGWVGGNSGNEIVIERTGGGRSAESVDGPFPNPRDTFYYQLRSFADEVSGQERRGSVGMPWDYIGANRAT